MTHSIDQISDEILVERIRSKDQELYIHIVRRYQEKLIRYATYLVSDHDCAQDIAQLSFIKAFQNLNSFDTRKKFSSWIYRIVHNESMNAIKKRKKSINLEPEQWRIVESDQNIEEEYNQKELQSQIKKSLNKLPLEYKAPLTLYFLENRSYEEISDILRIPINTVGTRISRGKKMLKPIVEDASIKKVR